MAFSHKQAIKQSVSRIAEYVKQVQSQDGTEPMGAVRDILTELRHYCDANGLDFFERAEASCDVYLEEKKLAEELG